MPLDEYRRKRDFARTPEPGGNLPAAPVGTRRFVVQKHRATRLHYDLRLEVDGVLVSWAVPKGPSLDPGVRRMAVHVEDHPLEYFDFEGIIPAGQYGGGDVTVWDWGTWQPEAPTPDPRTAIEAGELKFVLQGEKVRGRFVLVRTHPRPGPAPAPGEQEQWLLIHKRDGEAVEGWDAADHPRSVRSGRTNDEVRADVPAIWVSAAPLAQAQIDLSAAVAAPLPRFVEPMAATLADAAFDDPKWLFEVKWDGYRLEAVVSEGTVRLFTRNGNDGADYAGSFLDPPDWIDAHEAVVDGELVALDEAGRPDFGLLAEGMTARRAGLAAPLVYQVFDLLHLDGRSLLDVPLEERKRLLRLVLHDGPRVRFAGHVEAEGRAFLAAAAEQGLEGIVAKHRRSRYEPGRRAATWLKVKLRPEQELVVGGWTPERGRPGALGALAVGVHDADGVLRFAGKVGSGFTERTRATLLAALNPLAVQEPPFEPAPDLGARGRWGGGLAGITWVRPDLVIRASMGGWSRDGMVRQGAFRGIEAGRDPRAVVRERAVPAVDALQRVELQEGAPSANPTDGEAVGPSQPEPLPARLAPPGLAASVTPAELQALAALPERGQWVVGGQVLSLTNLDKALFPARADSDEAPITKREVVAYFAQVAPAMLAHLRDRPVNLHRFPNGADRPGFWQKAIPASAPSWLTRWHETGLADDEEREPNDHLVADCVASLAWLGNQAAFEIHAWTSTTSDPGRPTFALIDIDPGPSTTWEQTLTLARLYRTALAHLGVRGCPKTTGSRGLQVWIPVLRGRYEYADTSAWVHTLSRAIGATVPDLVSWQWSTTERGGRARLDYTQNAPIKTLVAPYAIRPRPGAPVSMPITWDELDDPQLRSDRWTLRTALGRIERVGDLFAAAQTDHQELPPL
ncbi:MAG: DNA ligase D [Candidatus Nanopelagicales bacterium]